MPITVLSVKLPSLHPVTAPADAIKIAGRPIAAWIEELLSPLPDERQVEIRADFIPSPAIIAAIKTGGGCFLRDPDDNTLLLKVTLPGLPGTSELRFDDASLRIRYPWDLLTLNEKWMKDMTGNDIKGTLRNGATVDGFLHLGEGSVVLPGVYMEGNIIIGRNCKIGPNCYLRGSTAIGDGCHIGQAVEIKNSLIGDKVSIGHLSYAGDSVICDRVNFGAGTIVSNLRHDGRNHRWLENREFLDTGRRKFGAVVGAGVHTGIHTAIYPGRSLSEGSMTVPGEVVSHSK